VKRILAAIAFSILPAVFTGTSKAQILISSSYANYDVGILDSQLYSTGAGFNVVVSPDQPYYNSASYTFFSGSPESYTVSGSVTANSFESDSGITGNMGFAQSNTGNVGYGMEQTYDFSVSQLTNVTFSFSYNTYDSAKLELLEISGNTSTELAGTSTYLNLGYAALSGSQQLTLDPGVDYRVEALGSPTYYVGGGNANLEYSLTASSVSAPEPSVAWLLLFGLVILFNPYARKAILNRSTGR